MPDPVVVPESIIVNNPPAVASYKTYVNALTVLKNSIVIVEEVPKVPPACDVEYDLRLVPSDGLPDVLLLFNIDNHALPDESVTDLNGSPPLEAEFS
jgi:hypothetical protein